MRLLPARWSIDRWPMRTIVSLYLLVSGALLAFAGVLVGVAQTSRLIAVQPDGAIVLTPAIEPHAPLVLYQAASAVEAAGFLAAIALMWSPWRWKRLPAFAAGLAAAAAWWFIAYVSVTPPNHPTALAAGGLFVLTAIVTLGALAAIVRRAPAAVGSGDAPGLIASGEDRSTP